MSSDCGKEFGMCIEMIIIIMINDDDEMLSLVSLRLLVVCRVEYLIIITYSAE